MAKIAPFKPLISAVIALLFLGSIVFIDTSANGFLQGPFFNFNEAGANAVKWGVVMFVGIMWVLVQLFLAASAEASRLALALSGSVLWIGLILFYRFADPAYGGVVAFFALVGGLVIVITWTHYLADEF